MTVQETPFKGMTRLQYLVLLCFIVVCTVTYILSNVAAGNTTVEGFGFHTYVGLALYLVAGGLGIFFRPLYYGVLAYILFRYVMAWKATPDPEAIITYIVYNTQFLLYFLLIRGTSGVYHAWREGRSR